MKSLLVANWKMNPATFKEAKALLDATRKAGEKAKQVSIVLAPPSIYLRQLRLLYKGKRIAFCAQNARAENGGALTGEMSLVQARDAKASYVLVGHAERRALGETSLDTRKKVAAALALNMTPVLCIGETERTSSGAHFAKVAEQLSVGLADVQKGMLKKVLIAYEPVWAIGGTHAMTPRDMHEMAIFIRKTVVGMHGEVGMQMRILYGGSIDETNAADMCRNGDVEGLLVGRASSDPRKITSLIASLQNA
ncbi:MAG: triose-phosphate isomerase [Candidatus Pacebacteria bacterium]|nr:triose-phosphate isomerase [Candidatus Paceibacterota bacterium]